MAICSFRRRRRRRRRTTTPRRTTTTSKSSQLPTTTTTRAEQQHEKQHDDDYLSKRSMHGMARNAFCAARNVWAFFRACLTRCGTKVENLTRCGTALLLARGAILRGRTFCGAPAFLPVQLFLIGEWRRTSFLNVWAILQMKMNEILLFFS